MSLLWYGRRITRAVAGELSGPEELDLRRHLGGCDACRARYDLLTVTARVARQPQAPTGEELERGLHRLLEGLPTDRRASPRTAGIKWVVLAAALGLGVALLVSRPPEPEVRERGGGDAPRALSVRVYAKTKNEPVRLVADLPTAGEARVAHGDWVQFKLDGAAIVSGQRDEEPPRVFEPNQSVALEAGRWRLFIQAAPLAQKQPAGVLWVE